MFRRNVLFAGLLFGAMTGLTTAQDEPKRLDPVPAFRRFDSNRDGKLSKAEFEAFSKVVPKLKENASLAGQVFEKLDVEKDGSLTLAEFEGIFAIMGRPTPKPAEEPKPKPDAEPGPAANDDDHDKKKKPRYPPVPEADGVSIVPEAWATTPKVPLAPGELDALLLAAQRKEGLHPAELINDEQFLRRVHLDLCGRLPTPGETNRFVTDQTPNKREKLVEQLLHSEDFAKHLARGWRDIMVSRATAKMIFIAPLRNQALEAFLTAQFLAGKSWAAITRELLTAEGTLSLQNPIEGGAVAFLLNHTRDEAPVERANDTARVFLGVNIQCAQCHDAPNDIWKRRQFHEFAAFFGKTGDRIIRKGDTGLKFETSIAARPFGDYRMPDQEDPKKTYAVSAKFFINDAKPKGYSDKERRSTLADCITAKDNYYFAAAFVNRVWADLMGQPFVTPVDSLGPLAEPVYPEVLNRLAASFAATDHDIRRLYKTIILSDSYQRQFRLGTTRQDHLHFTGTYPTPMRWQDLFASLNIALGTINGSMRVAGSTPIFRRIPSTFIQVFEQTFSFDLSKPADEIEGSVPQKLMLMNNPQLLEKMKATGPTVLADILKNHRDDSAAVKAVYQRVLGRSPTTNEMNTCLAHIRTLGNRAAAFEDIMWALINSTEFRTER